MDLLTTALTLLGVGFFAANVSLVAEYLRFRRRRPGALLIWPTPAPPQAGLTLALGVLLGFIVFYKVALVRQLAFGETMMFVYYAYLSPILRRRIGLGFYRDGIWADTAFLPYEEIAGITWREGAHSVALVATSRRKQLARRLTVPVEHYAAARRLLRDKIGERTIHLEGAGLELGVHDQREEA